MLIKKRTIFLCLLGFILINSIALLLMNKYGNKYLLLVPLLNYSFYFILKKNGLSTNWAFSIVSLMVLIFGGLLGSVYNRDRTVKLSDNNYSMLGIVIKTMKCHLDFYQITIRYLTPVDNYYIRHIDLLRNNYLKLKPQINDTVLLITMVNENYSQVISWHPSRDTLELFQKPIKYVDGEEIGNYYYYYAKLRADNSLKHFGLNVAFKGLYGKDTILFYRNLNSAIDSVSHRLADTLQIASNRALIGDSFAFLFHDGIYTKEQVFEEIPQAKEYYLKYCKETDSATNIISDTTNTP